MDVMEGKGKEIAMLLQISLSITNSLQPTGNRREEGQSRPEKETVTVTSPTFRYDDSKKRMTASLIPCPTLSLPLPCLSFQVNKETVWQGMGKEKRWIAMEGSWTTVESD